MEFMVVGADGEEYGPAGIDVLKQWVAEGRLTPATNLRNFQTGAVTTAGGIAELFPVASPPSIYAAPPAPVQYPRGQATVNVNASSEIWRAILYAIGALVSFFLLGGFGFFFGVYGVIYAARVMQKGHKAGVICLVIAIGSLLAVGVGWALGLQGGVLRR